MRNFISRAGILLRGSSRNSTFDLPDRLSSRHLLDTPVANIGEHGAGASALGLAFGPSLGALEYGGVCNLEYSSNGPDAEPLLGLRHVRVRQISHQTLWH